MAFREIEAVSAGEEADATCQIYRTLIVTPIKEASLQICASRLISYGIPSRMSHKSIEHSTESSGGAPDDIIRKS